MIGNPLATRAFQVTCSTCGRIGTIPYEKHIAVTEATNDATADNHFDTLVLCGRCISRAQADGRADYRERHGISSEA